MQIQKVSSQWYNETLDGFLKTATHSMDLMRYYPPQDPRPPFLRNKILGLDHTNKSNKAFMIRAILADMSPGLHKSVYFDANGNVLGAICYEIDQAKGLEVVGIGSVKPGVGRMLMRHAIRQANKIGAGLSLKSLREAKPFYEKLGLEETDQEESIFEASPKKVTELVSKI
jgi:hypothetical protein